MFSKRNPMKYFSGNAFARLPLYKLVAGGSAVVLTASIGLGVMAASFTPQAQPEPDKDLYVDVTVVQQDIGVELYTLPTTTPENASDKDEDAEEKRRRMEAKIAAENLGAVIGFAAGTAMAVNEKLDEQSVQEKQQQTMGGL